MQSTRHPDSKSAPESHDNRNLEKIIYSQKITNKSTIHYSVYKEKFEVLNSLTLKKNPSYVDIDISDFAPPDSVKPRSARLAALFFKHFSMRYQYDIRGKLDFFFRPSIFRLCRTEECTDEQWELILFGLKLSYEEASDKKLRKENPNNLVTNTNGITVTEFNNRRTARKKSFEKTAKEIEARDSVSSNGKLNAHIKTKIEMRLHALTESLKNMAGKTASENLKEFKKGLFQNTEEDLLLAALYSRKSIFSTFSNEDKQLIVNFAFKSLMFYGAHLCYKIEAYSANPQESIAYRHLNNLFRKAFELFIKLSDSTSDRLPMVENMRKKVNEYIETLNQQLQAEHAKKSATAISMSLLPDGVEKRKPDHSDEEKRQRKKQKVGDASSSRDDVDVEMTDASKSPPPSKAINRHHLYARVAIASDGKSTPPPQARSRLGGSGGK